MDESLVRSSPYLVESEEINAANESSKGIDSYPRWKK